MSECPTPRELQQYESFTRQGVEHSCQAETSGAAGSEPDAANLNKSVEKHLFSEAWFSVPRAPRRTITQVPPVTIVHLTVQPRVFQGPLRNTEALECRRGKETKDCFAGLIQSRSKSKKEGKKTFSASPL